MIEFYRPPKSYGRTAPKLPARVYETKLSRAQKSLFILIPAALFLFWRGPTTLENYIFLALISIPVSLSFLVRTTGTIYADLASDYVSAKLHDGRELKREPIENFIILVSQSTRTGGATNYTYAVSLIWQPQAPRLANRKKPFIITISDRILCPKNLRQWVEGLQKQLKQPLNIVFSDEIVMNDYETGVFESLKKGIRPSTSNSR